MNADDVLRRNMLHRLIRRRQLGLEVVNVNIIVGLSMKAEACFRYNQNHLRIFSCFVLDSLLGIFSCIVLDSLVIMSQLQTTMTNSLIS